jgi:hypothetical protein
MIFVIMVVLVIMVMPVLRAMLVIALMLVGVRRGSSARLSDAGASHISPLVSSPQVSP